MPKYIAKQSIGQFMPGEEIKGLDAKRIQALLASGAIEEYQEPDEPKEDGTAARLAELAAEVVELKANEEILIAGKDKADAEVVELKANEEILIAGKDKADAEVVELKTKVTELEKAVADSQAALKKATAEAKKAATPTEK